MEEYIKLAFAAGKRQALEEAAASIADMQKVAYYQGTVQALMDAGFSKEAAEKVAIANLGKSLGEFGGKTLEALKSIPGRLSRSAKPVQSPNQILEQSKQVWREPAQHARIGAGKKNVDAPWHQQDIKRMADMNKPMINPATGVDLTAAERQQIIANWNKRNR